jgi:hypothetical protein
VNRADLFRMWLRPVAAVVGLIGAGVAAAHGEWLAFGVYLAVFVAFAALTILMMRDLRAGKAKLEPGAQPTERAGS